MARKYKNQEVKQIFSDREYELIDDYKNVKTKMTAKNKNGYLVYCSLDSFLHGDPEVFHKCNPYTIKNIELWIALNNKKYKLKSETYINNSEHLILECPIHGEFKMSWNNMLHGNDCGKCYEEKRGEYKIFSYEYVKDYIENKCANWKKLKLISTQYVSIKDKLITEDDIGYKYSLCFDNIKQAYLRNQSIETVSKHNEFSIENIKLWLKLNNKTFELISEKYIDYTSSNLKFRCEKGHIFNTSWCVLMQGCGCNICAKNKRITTEDAEQLVNVIIKDIFDFKLLNISTDITTKRKKLTLLDDEGYKYYIDYSNLKQYHRRKSSKPTRFGKNNIYTIENINLWLKLNNKPFELIENKFIKANRKMKFKCTEGHIFKTRWNDIYSDGASCTICNQSKGERRVENYLITNNFIKIYNDESHNSTNDNNKYYIPQKEFDGLLGQGGKNLSYDFYLSQYNLLIEYQGEFHDGNGNYYMKKNLKRQKEHDRRKKEYAESNKIQLLEIWYWDYDNIEEILDKKLNEINFKEVI